MSEILFEVLENGAVIRPSPVPAGPSPLKSVLVSANNMAEAKMKYEQYMAGTRMRQTLVGPRNKDVPPFDDTLPWRSIIK